MTPAQPLRDRVRSMAERWNYAPDELDEALRLAEVDPAAWARLVAHDEALRCCRETPEATKRTAR